MNSPRGPWPALPLPEGIAAAAALVKAKQIFARNNRYYAVSEWSAFESGRIVEILGQRRNAKTVLSDLRSLGIELSYHSKTVPEKH